MILFQIAEFYYDSLGSKCLKCYQEIIVLSWNSINRFLTRKFVNMRVSKFYQRQSFILCQQKIRLVHWKLAEKMAADNQQLSH